MYPREEPFPRGGLSSGSLLKSSSMSRYPLPLPLLMPRVVVGDESCSNRSWGKRGVSVAQFRGCVVRSEVQQRLSTSSPQPQKAQVLYVCSTTQSNASATYRPDQRQRRRVRCRGFAEQRWFAVMVRIGGGVRGGGVRAIVVGMCAAAGVATAVVGVRVGTVAACGGRRGRSRR